MPEYEVSQKAIATILKLTTRQIRNLGDAGMPSEPAPNGRGRLYDLRVAVPWYLERERDRAKRNTPELDRAKLERAQLEVRHKQVEVDKAEGRTIDIDDHSEVVGKLVDQFRGVLLGLPGTWGARVVGLGSVAEGTEAMRRCSDEIVEAIASFADQLEVVVPIVPLPDDFPGYRHLVAAGVSTYGSLQALGDPTTVKGIGPATAKRIQTELAA